jgi:Uncharacterized conserved protein
MPSWKVFAVIIAVIGVIAMSVNGARNGLVTRDEAVNEHWSQINTQLQRRADLIPNIVNTVKGYAGHEASIFMEVANARSRLLAAKSPVEAADASAEVSSSLGRLLAVAENYPDLKANENFIRLQDEISGTENRIATARTRYNAAVRDFNGAIRRFPGSYFASGLGLSAREYYEPKNLGSMQEPPKVEF